jgi:hypothetical protein
MLENETASRRFYIQSAKLIPGFGQRVSNVSADSSPREGQGGSLESPRTDDPISVGVLPLILKFLTQSGEMRARSIKLSNAFGRLYARYDATVARFSYLSRTKL